MGNVIKFKLDSADIDRAIKELRAYRKALNEKIELFVDALLSEGIKVAKAKLASAQGDTIQANADAFYIDSNGAITKAIIVLDGPDVLFVEFGSGIYYNNGNNHPKAAEFGYGVGTYPSEHPPNRAINPGYWWYRKNGELQFSLGTEATMPLFNAAEEMRNQMIIKATEIFRS